MDYSLETNELLISMYQDGYVNKTVFPNYVLHTLFADEIIRNTSDFNDNRVYLTDRGKAYVEKILKDNKEKRSDKLHRWINSVGVILSLIVSVIALLK